MCQAFAGEQRMMYAIEKNCRQRGYYACKGGASREDNPERLNYCREAWDLGWRIADNGQEIW